MGYIATDWATHVEGINLTEKGALTTLCDLYNTDWGWCFVNYEKVQKIWGYHYLREVNRMLARLRSLGLIEAKRSKKGVLQYRPLIPESEIAKRRKKTTKKPTKNNSPAFPFLGEPGTQDHLEERHAPPVTLTTEWSDEDRIPPLVRDKNDPEIGTNMSQNLEKPGHISPKNGTNMSRPQARNERANRVYNPVGKGTPVKELAKEEKEEDRQKLLLTRYGPNDDNDDGLSPFPSLPSLFQLYEANLHSLTPLLRSRIEEAVNDYSAAWVGEAITIAGQSEPKKRNWPFTHGILRRWASQGKEKPHQSTGDGYDDRNKYLEDYRSRRAIEEITSPTPETQQLWSQALLDLEKVLPTPAYVYLKDVRALSTTQDSITLEASTSSAYVRLERSYYGLIQKSLERVGGVYRDINFVLGPGGDDR